MMIQALKLFDRIVGGLVASLAPEARSRPCRKPARFLVIRPGGIGDAVLLIPTLLALKENFTDAQITVLAEKRNGAVFDFCPAVDRVLLYDRFPDLLTAIRGDYDVVIDTEQWHRLSAIVARLAGAPLSIGFATNERKKLFTHQVSYSHDEYEAGSFFNLLSPLGINKPVVLPSKFLEVPKSVQKTAREKLGKRAAGSFVVIFPGASIPERRWGGARFQTVAEMLISSGCSVVVIGGREDIAEAEIIAAGGNVLNLAGQTNLVETGAIIEMASVLVSGDSGVLHLGVGLDVPTVSLFGPGRAKKWAPRGSKHVVLNRNLPCSPCTTFGYTPRCLKNAECLVQISEPEVVRAIQSLLKRQWMT